MLFPVPMCTPKNQKNLYCCSQLRELPAGRRTRQDRFSMRIQSRIPEFFQNHFAFLCIASLAVGVMIGSPAGALAPATPWLMGVLMFSSGLDLRVQDLACLRGRPWLLPVILLLLHVAIPLVWMGISTMLRFPLEAVMGFTILAIIPVSASCIVWISLCRGNTTLGMALILVDSLAAPFIIPYVLSVLFGADVHVDTLRMLRGLLWMLFFPIVLALFCNRATNDGLRRVAGRQFAIMAKLAILAMLCINGGVVSPYFRELTPLFVLTCGMTLCFCALLFLISFFAGRVLFTRKEDVLAFMLCSVRTTTTGMVIAMTYFPPLVTLTVAFAMLFQQPLGAWTGKTALRFLEKRAQKGEVAREAEDGMPHVS